MVDTPSYVPDILTPRGFWTVVSTGNIIEFAVALDHRTYRKVKLEDADEHEPAMSKYRFFIRWFTSNFVVLIDGQWVSATYLFWRSLVNFAAVLLKYKTAEFEYEQLDDSLLEETFTPAALELRIRDHFHHNWPELLPFFERRCKDPGIWLTWQQEFEVMPRTPETEDDLAQRGLTELAYFPKCPVFQDATLADETAPPHTSTTPPPNAGTHKRARPDVSPNVSPNRPSLERRTRAKRTRKSATGVTGGM